MIHGIPDDTICTCNHIAYVHMQDGTPPCMGKAATAAKTKNRFLAHYPPGGKMIKACACDWFVSRVQITTVSTDLDWDAAEDAATYARENTR